MDNITSILALIGAVIIIAAVYSVINRRHNAKKLMDKIDSAWAREPSRKNNTDRSAVYFNKLRELNKDTHYIDDITWHDLDMDKVFAKINSTWSTTGGEYLYAMLREPQFDQNVLAERDRLIRLFAGNRELRNKLQFQLARLGRVEAVDIPDYFYNTYKDASLMSPTYRMLAVAPLAAVALMFVNAPFGFFLLLTSIITNLTVSYKAKNEISSHLIAMSYIVTMIRCAKKVSAIHAPELSTYMESLQASAKRVQGMIKKSSLFLYKTEDMFIEYIKVFFLAEVLAFQGMFRSMFKYTRELHEIYETLGSLDSLIAIASYRERLKVWCTPELAHFNKTGIRKLQFEDIAHPLIDQPVTNSIKTLKPVLLTGSNASGKSTFLKTTAINAILAQTIYTCLAESYKSCYSKIYTSMALRDSLESNDSYYIAEIKSLKRIIDSLEDEVPVLCFIDEVLRGTNTVERIAASSQALYYLSASNCLCFAATHDIELTSILQAHFDNYHFQEEITNNEITFDYKLYSDRSKSRNAIKLLKLIGYEDFIVEEAEERAAAFIKTGSWREIEKGS